MDNGTVDKALKPRSQNPVPNHQAQ